MIEWLLYVEMLDGPLDHRIYLLAIFLWGYLKAKVCEHRPTTIPALKEAIVREIAAIPREMIENVM